MFTALGHTHTHTHTHTHAHTRSAGIATLRRNNIVVHVMDGDEARQARELIADFVARITGERKRAHTRARK